MTGKRRRVARDIYLGFTALCLAGAAVGGWLFPDRAMDRTLIQLVFYGAWSCLFGARVGGLIGAMMEEDRCSELDMGVLSSMGAMLGTLAGGLVGTAITGLGLSTLSWEAVWVAAVALAATHALIGRLWPLRVERLAHLDDRGRLLGSDGSPLEPQRQPLRMPDRLGLLLALSAAVVLGLTLVMAAMMGGDLGHPVMMAPMMYGMSGTMLGGLLGGWLAGLLDEHEGHPDHDNPIMVAAMALMAGMMGGMPSGMLGGMMAIMGPAAIGWSVAGGLGLLVASWAVVMRGRYRFARAPSEAAPRATEAQSGLAPPLTGRAPIGHAVLQVQGMTCDACRVRVERGLSQVPGVTTVQVDVERGTVEIRWTEAFSGLDAVGQRIEALGYELVGGVP